MVLLSEQKKRNILSAFCYNNDIKICVLIKNKLILHRFKMHLFYTKRYEYFL